MVQNNKKGGNGENNDPKKVEKKGKEQIKLVRVEYIDPVLVRKSDPRGYIPSIREAVGWNLSDPDENHEILFRDKPLSFQKNERLHPEVAFVIPKSAILGVWDIIGQHLRSK